MNNIDVSIIIPVYNRELYIAECLNSVISQEFDHSYEIILIDNGSTDRSLDISRNILNNCEIPSKIIVQKNNLGASNARNKGIKNASGKYIVFLDDDDWISKNHLNCLYRAISNNDFAFTGLAKIDESKNIVNESIIDSSSITTIDLIKLELTMRITFSFCQLMYSRDLIKEFFVEGDIYGEDTDFALKNLINGQNVGICSDITYFYRQHNDSSINKADFKRFEFIHILENLEDYFRDYPQLVNLIITNRIPKAIFGNMLFFLVNDYSDDDVIEHMNKLNLFYKLKNFKGDLKYRLKINLFLLNPRLYIKLWKKFKNSI